MTPTAGESVEAGIEPVPYLRPHKGAAQFVRRAERLAVLAEGNSLGDFLAFCGQLSAAQAVAAKALTLPADQDERPLVRAEHAGSPLQSEWTSALGTLMAELASATLPPAARAGLARLATLSPQDGLQLAGRILSSDLLGLDLAAAPFAAAALQVQFVVRAARRRRSVVGYRSEPGCPLCASPPVAGVVLGDERLRYLTCALCGSEWYLPRVKCAHCHGTGGISYFSINGVSGVKAEVCANCERYTKLFDLEERPATEPVADDLATFPIDVLVSDQRYRKAGVNLLLPS